MLIWVKHNVSPTPEHFERLFGKEKDKESRFLAGNNDLTLF